MIIGFLRSHPKVIHYQLASIQQAVRSGRAVELSVAAGEKSKRVTFLAKTDKEAEALVLALTEKRGEPQDGLPDRTSASKVEQPSTADYWSSLGLASEGAQRYEEALQHYDKALALAPLDADCWYNRGGCLVELGRPAEAVESYRKAVEIGPKDASYLYGLAYAEDELGHKLDAVAAYQKYLVYASVTEAERIQHVQGRLRELTE